MKLSYDNSRFISICCLYLPPSKTIDKQKIREILTQMPKPTLLIGDLNCHNPLWGCTNLNTKGRIIEDNNLNFFNTKEPTYFSSTYNSWSTIVMMLGSPTLTDSIYLSISSS